MPSDPETDALLAVARALTEDETRQLLANTAARWPRCAGADVADILDLTDNHDLFLETTEPFFEARQGDLPDVRGLRYAAHALIILGRELTVPALLDLMGRAGLITTAGRQDDADWLRRFITANLKLCARPDAGLTAAEIGVSIGQPAQVVDHELHRMRDEGLVARYEAGDGRNRRTRWHLPERG